MKFKELHHKSKEARLQLQQISQKEHQEKLIKIKLIF
jgi:hypothetical protein